MGEGEKKVRSLDDYIGLTCYLLSVSVSGTIDAVRYVSLLTGSGIIR